MRIPVAIEVIDVTMDDTEIEVQNSMFERIMDICTGNPTKRVLQVLIDTLACTAVTTGTPLKDLLADLVLSYDDALPKEGREN